MDTSDEYIEMCEKAEEIQSHWKFTDGDYIYGRAHGCKLEVNIWSGYDAWDYPCYPSNGIWLLRQDQLQDMIKMDLGCICWEFNNSINTERFHSYEQLWLVFVMQKIYKKRWNGSEWVKR